MSRTAKGAILLGVSTVVLLALIFVRSIVLFALMGAGSSQTVVNIASLAITVISWIAIVGIIAGIYLSLTKGGQMTPAAPVAQQPQPAAPVAPAAPAAPAQPQTPPTPPTPPAPPAQQ